MYACLFFPKSLLLFVAPQAGLLENVLSSDFVALVRLIERFVNNSAHVTGRHCPNLRSALLTQVREREGGREGGDYLLYTASFALLSYFNRLRSFWSTSTTLVEQS